MSAPTTTFTGVIGLDALSLYKTEKRFSSFYIPCSIRSTLADLLTKVVVNDEVEEAIKETCLEISERYEITFLEIGTDKDHIHFFLRSVPSYSLIQIAKTIKSITVREVFRKCPNAKKKLRGRKFMPS